ncbi:MaoC family dehydratase N-terminal domain-containing protein [Haloarcula sp. H-GB4]|uniref:MaoC family dehydratase N-terminal domain-containing protein n=1 Tax=Haloarcula sp. H-GB4 TaxID=3069755 RepID=UPI0027B50793|nr:MaoC family dehydratase N-terminal domain-containing protein [Haloarcula sp. H-GB4]MDQ2074522.1 MaoC family dehydratase N-terminal domain-containing protein [Haloarcula sp. H-GB4]
MNNYDLNQAFFVAIHKKTTVPSKPLEALRETIGETNRTVEDFEVERGKVAEFARAIHDTAEIYFNEAAAHEAGYETIPAPPTFPRTSYFSRYRPEGIDYSLGFDLGFDRARVVHGEQKYKYNRPLYVGDVLVGDTTMEEIYQREGRNGGTMTFAVLRTDFRDKDGEHVLSAYNTRIETGGAIAGESE